MLGDVAGDGQAGDAVTAAYTVHLGCWFGSFYGPGLIIGGHASTDVPSPHLTSP